MSDNFIGGLFAKAPHERAPDFVKAGISIKLADFAQYLRELKATEPDAEWLNIQIKESRGGKWYAEKDNWKPDAAQKAVKEAAKADADLDSDLPF